jgi:hypothetical protein
MTETVQNFIVLGIVGAALAYVGWSFYQTFAQRKASCGCGKGGCAKMMQSERDLAQAGKGKRVSL